MELALSASGVVGLWDWMLDSNLLHGDVNFARLYGLDPEKTAAGLTMEDYQAFVVVDDLPRLREDIRDTFMRGTDFLVEYRLAIPGEPLRWVECKGKLIDDAHGRPVRFSGTAVDITTRKQADNATRLHAIAARANAERVQLALAAGAIVGTWVWDIKTNQFTVDAGFANAFGLDPALGHQGISLEQVIGTVHPDDKAGLIEAVTQAVKEGGAYMHQYRVRRHDRAYYWVEANGRVELDDDGNPDRFPGVLIDITARRGVEAERDRVTAQLRDLNATLEQRVEERTAKLVETQEALRQSQKMEAVGQLTGGLAHDFNNLLAGISGALQLMQLRALNGQFKDVERYILTAQSGVKRAAALTHRLLAFSRRQTLDPRPADVNRLVADMLELVQRTVGPGIAVNVISAPDLWHTLVDPSQLENALLNLCINARDAMPDGGHITIETGNRWLDEHTAHLHDIPSGPYLSLSVSDSGVGMAPDILDKAFEPFFTTKPVGEGTGLGLSMVYGFARQSGGQARIDSAPGVGTTVCLYLPRHVGDVQAEQESAVTALPAAVEKPRSVLIVDDEPMIRMLVMETIGDLGYTALEAGDSATGLKILQSDVPIDLLVSDVGLPGGLNGRQMADAGRQVRPELKVLFITGYAENAAVGNGHLMPGMQVMTKPFDMQALASRIRALVEPQD
ncbi:PAS domain-containing protein [uncultured Massilia sp.]|uniref:PAS domain-containing protein n=1 Tax=uncultured Massilia sp. TaxID=169973 RepID=UPI0025DAF3A4|nr:PAS domain-containing protein [uncultured Massilia sp.]